VAKRKIPCHWRELNHDRPVRTVASKMRNANGQSLALILFARYTSHLLSELSFFTMWDETVHMAASHGVSVVRLPPTKVTASLSKTNDMQLAIKVLEAEDDSFIFLHTNKPFTSQHSIFDFTTASRKKSSSVIHIRRHTQVRFTQQLTN
jgi:hypothetical protein